MKHYVTSVLIALSVTLGAFSAAVCAQTAVYLLLPADIVPDTECVAMTLDPVGVDFETFDCPVGWDEADRAFYDEQFDGLAIGTYIFLVNMEGDYIELPAFLIGCEPRPGTRLSNMDLLDGGRVCVELVDGTFAEFRKYAVTSDASE